MSSNKKMLNIIFLRKNVFYLKTKFKFALFNNKKIVKNIRFIIFV